MNYRNAHLVLSSAANETRRNVMKSAWSALRMRGGCKATPRTHPEKWALYLAYAWRGAKARAARALVKPAYTTPMRLWSREPSRYFSAAVYASFGR